MQYRDVKMKLISLFHQERLECKPDEWGFWNEKESLQIEDTIPMQLLKQREVRVWKL